MKKGIILIPIAIIIDILTFFLCAFLDTCVIPDPNALGHPMPVTLILWFIFVQPFTIIMCIIGIISAATEKNKKKNKIDNCYYNKSNINTNLQNQSNIQIKSRCKNCGQIINSDSNFCTNCGCRLN